MLRYATEFTLWCASDIQLEQKRLLLNTGCRYKAEGHKFFLQSHPHGWIINHLYYLKFMMCTVSLSQE
jgi:hypothetical protein